MKSKATLQSLWMATVLVDKNPVDFKNDSGEDVTVVPYNTFLNLDLQTQLQPTDKVLLDPCNYKMNYKGKFTVTLTYNLNSVNETVYAVESLARLLLGRFAAVKLNLISRLCKLTSDDYKAKVMHDYPKPFTGLGMMKEEYTIKLKDQTKPFALTVPRKVPMPLYEETNHPLPSVDLTLGKLAGAKYFAIKIKWSESSSRLITFNTPWCRYCFNVCPME